MVSLQELEYNFLSRRCKTLEAVQLNEERKKL